MADFWNAFRVGQEARQHWDERRLRRDEREARQAQIGAVRKQYGDTSGGNVDDALAIRGDDRTQVEFDAERQRQAGIAALSAYRGMVNRAEGDGLRVDPEQQRAFRGEAFDRIANVLPALGVDASQVPVLREMLIDDPQRADELIAAMRSATGEAPSYAPRAVIDPRTGRPVFVRPGEEVGMESADEAAALLRIEQGDRRLGLGRDTLEQRQLENEPETLFDQSAARAEGRVAGEAAANQEEAMALADETISRIDHVLQADPDTLNSVLGMPTLSGALRGGLGTFAELPGSQAAAVADEISGLTDSLRLAAYQLVLKGGGQITEAESAFGAAAFANLRRSSSPEEFRRRLTQAREYFSNLQERYARRAAPSRNPNRTPRAPEAAPAEAPAARGLRQEGEDTDSLLDRLGL